MPAEKPTVANLNVTPETRAKAEKLAANLTKEMGVKVSRPEAVRLALEEALERHTGKKS